MFGRKSNRVVEDPDFRQLSDHIRQYPGYWWDDKVRVDDMFVFTIEEDLDTKSFREQVTLFSNADVIIGSHGAGATNIIFAHAHTPFIELFPYLYSPPCYRN